MQDVPPQLYLWDCLLSAAQPATVDEDATQANSLPIQLQTQSSSQQSPLEPTERSLIAAANEDSTAWQDGFVALFDSEASDSDELAAPEVLGLAFELCRAPSLSKRGKCRQAEVCANSS